MSLCDTGCSSDAESIIRGRRANERSEGHASGVGLMKLGLYSITYLGLWYRGPALTVGTASARSQGSQCVQSS